LFRRRPLLGRFPEPAFEDLEGEAARHLAPFGAAHTVGHGEEQAVVTGPAADRVLVVRTDPADVRRLHEIELGHQRATGGRPIGRPPVSSCEASTLGDQAGRLTGIPKTGRPFRRLDATTYRALTSAHAPEIAKQMYASWRASSLPMM